MRVRVLSLLFLATGASLSPHYYLSLLFVLGKVFKLTLILRYFDTSIPRRGLTLEGLFLQRRITNT